MSKSVHYKIDTKLAFLGFFVAFFSAGIGIGGGALLVSILISLFGFDFKKAASTSLSTIIPISFIGSLSHFILLPEISHLKYYYIFIPSCVFGTILGGRIVKKRQNRWLKIAFSIFLLINSLRMLKIFDFPFLIYSRLNVILFSNECLLIIPVGILIGIIAVLLGIGCGLLIVPFFVIIINLNIHEAIILSLTTIFFLSLSATIVNNKLKMLDIASFKSLFMNAVFRYLDLCDKTIHCKDTEPKLCANNLLNVIGSRNKVFLVGYQPRFLEILASQYNVRVVDIDQDNIGMKVADVIIEPPEVTSDIIEWSDLIFATGSTVVNGTITNFLNQKKPVLFYGVTISATAAILNLKKYCHCGH